MDPHLLRFQGPSSWAVLVCHTQDLPLVFCHCLARKKARPWVTLTDYCNLSLQLGIPTANIPPDGLANYPDLPTGVYYGLAGVLLPGSLRPTIHDAVLSIGYNPFYGNKERSIEIHLLEAPTDDSGGQQSLTAAIFKVPPASGTPSSAICTHPLPSRFYGSPLNLLVLGFIRPEYDYVDKDGLIDDIRIDCQVARKSLGRSAYRKFADDEPWLRNFDWSPQNGQPMPGKTGM